MIIGDLPGWHTPAERTARIRLVHTQRAAVEAEAGLARMLAHVGLLAELTEMHERRRTQDRIAEKDAESRAAYRKLRHTAPPVRKIRILYPEGKRVTREVALTADDLYLTDARPTFIEHPRLLHTCNLCLNAKSHPVVCVLFACRLEVEVRTERTFSQPPLWAQRVLRLCPLSVRDDLGVRALREGELVSTAAQ